MANTIWMLTPPQIRQSDAFFDKLTNIWRYEFGEPYALKNGQHLLGTQMWVPVERLVKATSCASRRLSPGALKEYAVRLANRGKHQDVLVEMLPMLRAAPELPATYEASGFGTGNRTVDWAIGPVNGRTVLLDVKRRIFDLIGQMDQTSRVYDGSDESVLPPDHDAATLFRSVETKLRDGNPEARLQGVWIVSDIKQEESKLKEAFENLNKAKVHFAILGNWEGEAYVLTQRPEDEEFLMRLLGLKPAAHFVWNDA